MNDPLEHVGRLAAAAKREVAPCGSVSRQVVRRIEQELCAREDAGRSGGFQLLRPLTVLAAATVAFTIAALLAIIGSPTAAAADSLGTFFQVSVTITLGG